MRIKLLFLTCIIFTLSILSSCLTDSKTDSYSNDLNMGENMLKKRIGALLMSKDDKIAERCVGNIIELINNRDILGLKEIFSENALKKTESFENDAESFLDFFDDKITSYENDGGFRGDRIDHGKKIVLYEHVFLIDVSEKQYYILTLEITEDDYNPKHIGVHAIQIKNEDGEELKALGTEEFWNDIR